VLNTSVIQFESQAGGNPTDLIGSQKNVAEVALVGSALFWTRQTMPAFPGGVSMINTDGTGYKQLLVTLSSSPYALAADAKGIYWSDTQTNTINYLSLDGTVQHVIAVSPNGNAPYNLQLDSQYVYFLTRPGFSDAAIFRVPR
jgi:hypothetical protein